MMNAFYLKGIRFMLFIGEGCLYKMKLLVVIIFVLLILSPSAFAGWTEPVRISERGGCLYPQILAQGDTLHVVYTNGSRGDYVAYIRSTNGGDTWSTFRILCDTNVTDIGVFVRICRFDRKLIVLWHDMGQGVLRYSLAYSMSNNSGVSWSGAQIIPSSRREYMYYFTAQSSDSVVSMIFNYQIAPEGIFYSFRSTDFGLSWSQPVEIFRAAQSNPPDGTCDDSGFHVVWPGRFDFDHKYEVYYIRSSDGGINWSPNIPLSDADQHHSQLPSISSQGPGNLAVAWMDFMYAPSGGTGDIFLRQSQDSGYSWSVESQLTFNHKAASSEVIRNGDTIHVAWEDESAGIYIYYNRSVDGGINWDTQYRLETDRSESRSPSLATSNGRVFAIWADARNYPDSNILPGIYFSRLDPETTGIDESPTPPHMGTLSAYPNPFNSITIIKYTNLKNTGRIEIINSLGQVVKTFNIKDRKEGHISWEATDNQGKSVASGVYHVRAMPADDKGLKLIYLK
jgi:hypothetical protein